MSGAAQAKPRGHGGRIAKGERVIMTRVDLADKSYKTGATQRERAAQTKKMLDALSRIDPWGLFPRPRTARDVQRMLGRWIELERSQVEFGDFIKREHIPKFLPAGRQPRTRGEKCCTFIENYCLVPEGPKAGKLIILDPFETRFILDVFDNPNETDLGILCMAKKNGKTTIIATIAECFITGPETRPNSQIVSGAMEKEQAAIVFNYLLKMNESSLHLNAWIDPVASRKRLFGTISFVEYRALAHKAQSTQGISPIVAILDEVGQVRGPNNEFIEAIETAQGAYDDALLFMISTQAADDADMFSIIIDDALSGASKHTVCHLYAADPGCDIMDEAQWRKANPALGNFRSAKDLLKLAEKAQRMPSFTNVFRNLNLNQRVERNTPFVSRDVWNENDAKPEPLDGLEVWGGLDLAEINDLCSLALCSLKYDVHLFNWMPKEGMADKQHNDKAPYDRWVEDGYIMAPPGRTVEYLYIAEFLYMLKDRCTLRKIGFDRYNFKHLRPWLLQVGFTAREVDGDEKGNGRIFEPYGQGTVSMSPPIAEMESLLLAKKIRHGGNPVLKWAASNVKVHRDSSENRKFIKARTTGRIDPMVALAIALGVMPSRANERQASHQVFVI